MQEVVCQRTDKVRDGWPNEAREMCAVQTVRASAVRLPN